MKEYAEFIAALYREFASTISALSPRIHGCALHVSRESLQYATLVTYRVEYDEGRSWDVGCGVPDSSVCCDDIDRLAHVAITQLAHLIHNALNVPQVMD